MILVDDRVGSREVFPYLKPYGIQAELTRLDYGDFAFEGNGAKGRCLVGIERKRVGDLIESIRSKRLSGHQLGGLVQAYDYAYLVVEGMFRPGKKGDLEEWRGSGWRSHGVLYREVNSYLCTVEILAGVVVRRSISPVETAVILADLYRWWQKDFSHHKSHDQIYAPVPEGRKAQFLPVEERVRRRCGEAGVLTMKMAAQLPGVERKAEQIALHFRTPYNMVTADEQQWLINGVVGRKMAQKFTSLLRGQSGRNTGGK